MENHPEVVNVNIAAKLYVFAKGGHPQRIWRWDVGCGMPQQPVKM